MSFKLIDVVPKRDYQDEKYVQEIVDWGSKYADFEYQIANYYRYNKDVMKFIVAEEELTAYGVSQVVAFAYVSVQINKQTNKLRCQVTRIDVNPNCKQHKIERKFIDELMKNTENILGDEMPEEFAFLFEKEDKVLTEILREKQFKIKDLVDVLYAEKYLQPQLEKGDN